MIFGIADFGFLVQIADSHTLSYLTTVNTNCKDISINNGAGGSSNNMFFMSFNSQFLTPPYSFTRSNSIGSYYVPQKTEAISADIQISGRGAIALIDSSQIYFSLEDIIVDEKPVKFIQVSDTTNFKEADTLNNYLVTDPFLITDNAKFVEN